MTADVKQSYIHGALLVANSIFGLGSIVGALGLVATNPLAFTFVREICSGSLLLLLSFAGRNKDHGAWTCTPAQADVPAFVRLGFLLFLNQLGYIVGLQLAGPVTGSVWQPSSPLFTVAISMMWGLEGWNLRRVAGILLAFGGCAAMVLLSDRGHDTTHGGTTAFWIGNAMFLLNCSSVAFYILLSKPVLTKYPSLTVTAWSYNVASVFMFAAALLSANLPAVETLICPACPPTRGTFVIPRATLPALSYYIIFQSVASWGLVLWANQYATGTLVVGYTVLQPVTAIGFTTLFLVTHWVASCREAGAPTPCLNGPGLGTLCGMVGVACGLSLVVQTEPNSMSDHPTTMESLLDHKHPEGRKHLAVDYGSVPLNGDQTREDTPSTTNPEIGMDIKVLIKQEPSIAWSAAA